VLKMSVTPKAKSDLIGIWVYTGEKWGVDQADKRLGQLESGQMINHESLGTARAFDNRLWRSSYAPAPSPIAMMKELID